MRLVTLFLLIFTTGCGSGMSGLFMDKNTEILNLNGSSSAIHVDINSSAPVPDGLSWSNAFKTIQEGIDAAFTPGYSEVWVAKGTYSIYESDPSDTLLLASGVYVYGGFLGNETDLSNRDWLTNLTTIDGTNQVYHVVTGVDNTAIDGFRIINENQQISREAALQLQTAL